MNKVSVIVPVYKVKKYIKKCLDSLINQTLKDIEIILIDDGSPDECGKICDDYAKKDSRIKVIHKKNNGVSAARNDGIKKSTGKYIMFADSDDWCEESMCQYAYDYIENTDAEIGVFNYYNNYQNGKEIINSGIPQKLQLDTYDEIEKLQMTIFHANFIKKLDSNKVKYLDLGAPWSKIFQREFIIENQLEFNTELSGVFDDIFFCLNALEKAKKVITNDKPLYHYRRLDNTLSTSFKENNLKIYNRITEECEKFVKQYNKGESFKEAYDARIFLNAMKLLDYYYFNPNNKLTQKQKIDYAKKMLNSNPYKESINNVNLNYLSKSQKIFVRLFRKNYILIAYYLYNIKAQIKKIKTK